MKLPLSNSASCRQLCLALAIAGAIAAVPSGALEAGPVSAGDEVENRAYLRADGLGTDGLSASFRFSVASIQGPAPKLTIMGCDPDGSGAAGYFLSGASYSASGNADGPFVPSAAPIVDTSGAMAPVGDVVLLTPVDHLDRGVAIFFVLEDAGGNADPAAVDLVRIALSDSSTGDVEFLELYESAADSGVFVAWINTTQGPGQSGDGVMSSTGASVLSAVYIAGDLAGPVFEARVALGGASPTGVIFDSRTGAPIDGVWITIVDADTGLPAQVHGDDAVALYPPQIASGGVARDESGMFYEFRPGEFLFPDLDPGRYRFVLSGLPDNYVAPSRLLDAAIALPAGASLSQGSRLEAFEISDVATYRIDIPIDFIAPGALDRSLSTHEMGPGEAVGVSVNISLPEDAGPLDLVETFPEGLSYEIGTLRVNGAAVSPAIDRVGRLVLPDLAQYGLGDLNITYTLRLALSAPEGSVAVSRSVLIDAQGNTLLSASSDLRVTPAFGSDKMLLIGRVLADGCEASLPDIDLSGVRILLESGEIATTDRDGRFSFRALSARPHVARIDESSLPQGVEPVLCRSDTRNTASANSVFVTAPGGMMDRVVFHVAVDPGRAAELARLAAEQSEWHPSDPAAGFDQEWLDAHPVTQDAQLVSPLPGYLPASQAIDIVVLKPKGRKTELRINGAPVDEMRAERPMTSETGDLVLERYRAVRIDPGRNQVELGVVDESGAFEILQSADVLFATTPEHAEIVAQGSRPWSDGRSLPHIRLRLSDAEGIALRPGTLVQLRVEAPDALMPVVARKSSPGYERRARQDVSVMVREDGIAEFDLAPVDFTRDVMVQVMSPKRELRIPIRIESRDRPWVLVGMAEGVVAQSGLRAHLRPADEDLGPVSGRLGLFAEGVIKGKYLMTLRIDSARDGKGPFGNLDPERDYLVYGDRSREEDGAPSRFPLYLRLASEDAELLIGDFDTGMDKGLVELSRTVTGARVMFENERWKVLGFAAGLENGQQEDRIALDGTLGPFALSHSDIAPGSESVRIIRVGGLDLGNEISSERLIPGIDYRLDARAGRIYLTRSWPAFDPEMNRYVLIANYRQNEGESDAGLLLGGRIEYRLSEQITLGASALHGSDVEGARVDMTGVDATWEPREGLSLEAAASGTRKNLSSLEGRGHRLRLEARYEGEEGSAYLRAESRRGLNDFDAVMERDDLDQIAIGATLDVADPRYAWLTEEDPYEGWRHSVQGLAERDAQTHETILDARLLSMRYRGEAALGGGFRLRSEKSGDAPDREMASAILRGEFGIAEGTGFVQADLAIVGHGIPVSDRIAVGYDRETGTRLGHHVSLEMARAREGGAISSNFGYGIDWKFNDALTISGGIGVAAGQGRSGGSWNIGFESVQDLSTRTRFEFGMSAQSDLGAADIPLSMGTQNPYIEKSFLSSHADLRHTRETWSAGVALSGMGREDSHAVTLRLAADGELGEGWSIGVDGLFTVGRDSEDIPIHDERFRLAMAWRREETDPFVMGLIERDRNGSQSSTLYGEILGSFPLGQADRLTLRGALKHSDLGVASGGSTIGLIGAEWRHQVSPTVDFGLHGAMMSDLDGDLGSATSLGASIGVSPFKNGWVGIGYNATGFEDNHFSANGTTSKGLFLEMRVKFDENTIKEIFR